jgi:PhoH-like ATPase
VGRNARLALRAIEELRVAPEEGSRTRSPAGGGTIRIESNHVDVPLPPYLDPPRPTTGSCAWRSGSEGTLVTKDAALRIKGSQLGVTVEDYRGDTARTEEHATGILDVEVEPEVLDDLHRDGKARIDAEVADLTAVDGELWPNACLVLKAGRSNSGLGRVIHVDDDGAATLHRVHGHRPAFGMSPRTSARPSRSTCCSTPTCRACP